jgi:hypothetical protein
MEKHVTQISVPVGDDWVPLESLNESHQKLIKNKVGKIVASAIRSQIELLQISKNAYSARVV